MKSKIACIAVLCFLFVSYGRVVWSLEQSPPLGLPSIPIPDENPQSQEKIDLGKRLFEDKRFSGDESVSCSTCHKPEKVFTDGLVVAEGIKNKKGTRNTPTVVNAGYYTTEFWDGRRPSLEEQAKDPFVNSVEHGLKDHSPIIDVIRSDSSYPEQFKKVFGIEPDAITIEHVVKAIASFERSLVSGDSPFDRYLYGNDKKAMSESAIRGLSIFRNKGRCVDCHTIGQTSAIFTDNDFHNLGVGFKKIEKNMFEIANKFRHAKEKGENIDEKILTITESSELGRFIVTLSPTDIGRFKTPALRNIALTAPYMHNGSIKTLKEVVDLYNQGGEDNPLLDGGIRPLNLTDQEIKDLVAFMESLTSPGFAERDTKKGEK